MHSTREKLKIDYFDREYVENFFSFSYILLLYFFLSIVSIFIAIYRALKVFYLISTNLSYKERRKLVNIFTLILESYNIILEYIMEIFFKSIKKLNRDFNLEINDEIEKICTYTIALIGDIF